MEWDAETLRDFGEFVPRRGTTAGAGASARGDGDALATRIHSGIQRVQLVSKSQKSRKEENSRRTSPRGRGRERGDADVTR